MKISGSEISLESQHNLVREVQSQERLSIRVGERQLEGVAQTTGQDSPRSMNDMLELSANARALQPTKAHTVVSKETDEALLNSEDELKLSLLKRMIEFLIGKKLNMAPPGEFAEKFEQLSEQNEGIASELGSLQPEVSPGPTQDGTGFVLEYDAYRRHFESESSRFLAKGQVVTADGELIDISVELNMSREFLREQSVSIRAGEVQLKDPLVLNFGGSAAELTNRWFEFDIDSDGRADQIAFVGPDSGFLALDRNADGRINDGAELFGPTTGEGFAELTEYDQDSNGWIDENDSVYDSLRIWSKTIDGLDQLVGLGERGVGAIYLGSVTSPFEIKDEENELLGQIRSSSLFLAENGEAGTVQQIDLAV